MKRMKKQIVIEAIQWNGDNEEEIRDFAGLKAQFEFVVSQGKATALYKEKPHSGYIIGISLNLDTAEGVMSASSGDYVVKDANGNIFLCKPNIFENLQNI